MTSVLPFSAPTSLSRTRGDGRVSSSLRPTRAAQLLGATALLVGAVGCADLPESDEVEATSSQALGASCAERTQILWGIAGAMASAVPGAGGLLSQGTSLIGAIQAGRCQQGTATFLTMDKLRAEISAVSGVVVDEALRAQLVDAADTLLRLLEPLQADLADLDALDPAYRQELSVYLESLATDAVFLESDTQSLSWPIIPVFVQFASLKLALYQLAYDLREPGRSRDILGARLALERQTSKDILLAHERSYAVTGKQRLTRESNFNSLDYSIDTLVTNGPLTPVEVHWRCTGSAFRPKQCDNRYDRRRQFFQSARDAFRNLRTKQMASLDRNYLSFKSALFDTSEAAFKLGAGGSNFSGNTLSSCMNASANGQLSLAPCGPADDTSNLDLLWAKIPGTGQLYNLGQHVCLQSNEAGELTSAACEALAPPTMSPDGSEVVDAPSPQRWGQHPSGYFLHQETGRCLSLAEEAKAKTVGPTTSAVVLKPCDFGSVGFRETSVYYTGETLDADLGEDVWRVMPTPLTDWQVD